MTDDERLPSRGIFRRIAAGSAMLAVGAVANTIAHIGLTPIAIHFWGAARFGEWLSLTALVSFLALTDLGLQTYVGNVLRSHFARASVSKFAETLGSALRMQLPMVAVLASVVGIALYTLPIERVAAFTGLATPSLRLAIFFLSLEFLLAVPTGTIAAAVRAVGELPYAAGVGVFRTLATFGATVVVMAFGGELAAAAAARLVVNTAIVGWLIFHLFRSQRWLTLARAGSAARGLKLLPPGLQFVAVAFAEFVALQIGMLALQKWAGGEDVSNYASHRTIANFARMGVTLALAAAWPEITALKAVSEDQRLLVLNRITSKLSPICAGLLLLASIPLALCLYPYWTLRALTFDLVLYGLLAADVVLWATAYPSQAVLAATNHQRRLLPVAMLSGVVVACLTVMLVPKLGARGAALASVITSALVTLWLIPHAACVVSGDRFMTFVRDVHLRLGMSTYAVVAATFILLVSSNVAPLFVCIVAAVIAAVSARMVLTPSERATLTRAVSSVIRPASG